jgi:hypothetical protein
MDGKNDESTLSHPSSQRALQPTLERKRSATWLFIALGSAFVVLLGAFLAQRAELIRLRNQINPDQKQKTASSPIFPTADSTGPSGDLAPSSGQMILREDNAIIENIDHTGTILVAANNVTIRNMKVTFPPSDPNADEASFAMIQLQTGSTNLVIEDCEINGSGVIPYGVLTQQKVTVRRCDISRVAHGANVANDFLIESNWIHDVADGGKGWHMNGVHLSTGKNGIVRKNNIEIKGKSVTGTVSLFAELGNTSNMLVEDNRLAGGAYCIYAEPKGAYTMTNIRILNNTFSTSLYPTIGIYGLYYPTLPADIVRTGNIVQETKQPANQ